MKYHSTPSPGIGQELGLGYNRVVFMKNFESKNQNIFMSDERPMLITSYKEVTLGGYNQQSPRSQHFDHTAFFIFLGRDHYYHAFFEGIGEALLLNEMFPDKKIVPTLLYIDDIEGDVESQDEIINQMVSNPGGLAHFFKRKLSKTNFDMYDIACSSFEKVVVIPTAYFSEVSFSDSIFICKHLSSPMVSLFGGAPVNVEYESYPWYRSKISKALRSALNDSQKEPTEKIFVSRRATSNRLRRMKLAVDMLKHLDVEFNGYVPVSDPSGALSVIDPELRIRLEEEMEHYDQRYISLEDENGLELMFESKGFDVISLEDLDLREQVERLAKAGVVATLSGASLFTTSFSIGNDASVIIIDSGESYGFDYGNMVKPFAKEVLNINLNEVAIDGAAKLVGEFIDR
jgi:hypothetical protein